ncbi:hypothetical protein SAMN05216548_12615 [Faunimonas pinastri]|uniref:Uncharacterized protein n=1 Tax=Faunimonas pinastri TaxID=1855383 RepID=A0A1H9Q9C5_9HYPH|nr:hypothetical protein [Faunimonas pinastri]SER57040.1 hypothetical protein SAMN05216548_12615 [Faunimonas pinastri]
MKLLQLLVIAALSGGVISERGEAETVARPVGGSLQTLPQKYNAAAKDLGVASHMLAGSCHAIKTTPTSLCSVAITDVSSANILILSGEHDQEIQNFGLIWHRPLPPISEMKNTIRVLLQTVDQQGQSDDLELAVQELTADLTLPGSNDLRREITLNGTVWQMSADRDSALLDVRRPGKVPGAPDVGDPDDYVDPFK